MRNVRLIYRKFGEAKYISHLDMNRVMLRAIRRTSLPVWYTEGFHPHVFITFALPLSLGFESGYEVMDFRLEGDAVSGGQALAAFKQVLPAGLEAVEVIDPVCKAKDLCFADFEIEILTDNLDGVEAFFNRDTILVEKKSKKGTIKTLDIKPKIKRIKMSAVPGGLKVSLTLPAGSAENFNPVLLLDEMKKDVDVEIKQIVRTALLDSDLNLFR